MSAAAQNADLFAPWAPAAIVAGGICAVLLCDLPAGLRRRGLGLWVGTAACLLAAGAALFARSGEVAEMLRIDAIALLAQPLIGVLTALVLLAGAGERRGAHDHGAWSVAVLGIGLGALLVAASANFVSLWLGLELVSLSSYVLATWRATDRKAAEAGMKYVLFGGAASGLMLYGMSHVYGLTGHLDFAGIGAAFQDGMPLPVTAALLLAGTGVAYKLTVVPFHFFAPDVYQGAPALGVAVVGTVPKVAAAAVLLRALVPLLPPALVPPSARAGAFAFAAILSLLVASLTALAQRDSKRIVAFSGIGHGGTVLLAVACLPGAQAGAAVWFYLLAYAAANLGALVCLSVFEREQGSCALADLSGAVQRRPWVTTALCLFLFSLAGVPPLAGFLGKWAVLQQSLQLGLGAGGTAMLAWAALALLVSTAIAAWSYLLIVRAAVLAPQPVGSQPAGERGPAGPVPVTTAIVLLVCAAATVGLGLWFEGLPAIARTLGP